MTSGKPALLLVSLLVASCSQPSGAPTTAEAPAAKPKGPGLGELMVGIGRRFELCGRASLAHRYDLAEFEANEILETFEDDVPGAELPKEGPTSQIPAMAEAFRKTNLPELKRAAKMPDPVAFERAFAATAAACNSCHLAAAKGFIEVPTHPGKAVPVIDQLGGPPAEAAGASGGAGAPSGKAIPLPGANGPAGLDYIAYEPGAHGGRVWVPAGGTGNVDVLDVEKGTFHAVEGWKTTTRDVRGEKRTVGPSSVAIGNGYAYVGNRAVNEVCAVDLKTLARGACFATPSSVDGVAALPGAHQVWITTPHEQSVVALDEGTAGALKLAGSVKLPGDPEGYAFDEKRSLFFTNLEDKAKTVAIDMKTRAVKSTWGNGCGEAGPRGIAVDGARDLVMVACTDHVEVLDEAHDGALLGKLDVGAGVDNIDYAPATQRLYVAAGKAARLSVLRVGPKGELTLLGAADTREGARNAVADAQGNVYVADSKGASLVVVPALK
jgi:DNA-binding beta-propeller fold protein YncE